MADLLQPITAWVAENQIKAVIVGAFGVVLLLVIVRLVRGYIDQRRDDDVPF